MATHMQVEVDPRRCCGYQLCVEVAPDLFEINSAGKARVLVDAVPVERHDAVRGAARECPQDAIRVREP
ncbi:MAG TPA: ferredoxin [Mycobacterium sp.]|jgi:ferredoxin|nr:ferredoxin [Mycobacterium sp.]